MPPFELKLAVPITAATGVTGWSFGVPFASGRRSARIAGRASPAGPCRLLAASARGRRFLAGRRDRCAVPHLTRLNTQTRLTRRARNFPGTPSAA
jgi:hypothetical protein